MKFLKNLVLLKETTDSSVYDTAAQIIAWEKKHGDKMYRDVMLDIETTDLLTANKVSNGKVTEITMMRRKSKK